MFNFFTDVLGGPLGFNLMNGGLGGPLPVPPAGPLGVGGGSPGAPRLLDNLTVPGQPQPPPDMGPKQIGLLRAGDDDMRAAAPGAPPELGAGLLKAGMEDSLGAPRTTGLLAGNPAVDVNATGAVPRPAPTVGPNPPPITIPAPAGVTTPPGSVAAPVGGGLRPRDPDVVTPPTVAPTIGGTQRPVDPDRMIRNPTAFQVPTPPRIDLTKPTSSGTTVTRQGPPPARAVPPAARPATQQPNKTKDLLAKMGQFKPGGGQGGGGAGTAPGRSPGSAGQPHRPQGGAALLQQILQAHQDALRKMGNLPRVPGALEQYLPPGLR